jgi:hypothetical protein
LRQFSAVLAVGVGREYFHFQIAPTSILTVTREGAQLSAQITGQPTFPIYADSDQEFHWQVVPARVTFSGNDNGLAATATIHQNGADIVAIRVNDTAAARFGRIVGNSKPIFVARKRSSVSDGLTLTDLDCSPPILPRSSDWDTMNALHIE